MVQPGSSQRVGYFLHKASQAVSLTFTVMNSNKMSNKGCLNGACELDHLRREEFECVAVAEPLSQHEAACILDFCSYNVWGGRGRHTH